MEPTQAEELYPGLKAPKHHWSCFSKPLRCVIGLFLVIIGTSLYNGRRDGLWRSMESNDPDVVITGAMKQWHAELGLTCKKTNFMGNSCALGPADSEVIIALNPGSGVSDRAACRGADFLISTPDQNVYPYEGVGDCLLRVLGQLDQLFSRRWDRIVIDVNLAASTKFPFKRQPGDRTGEIFTGRRMPELGSSTLVNCEALARDDNRFEIIDKRSSDESLYLWPPIAGAFKIVDPEDAKPALLRSNAGSIDGASIRGIFEFFRDTIEAWYSDPFVEDRMDVGHHAWGFITKVVSVDRPNGSWWWPKATDGWPMDEIFPGPAHKVFQKPWKTSPPYDATESGLSFSSEKYQARFRIPRKMGEDLRMKSHGTPGQHSYAVASIANDVYRIAMQQYLWNKQNVDINFVKGIDFSDKGEIDDHFGVGRHLFESQPPSSLLIHSHAKVTKAVCESGVDVAVIIEDDAFPLKNFKSHIEHTIDVLQKVSWGYHLLDAQYDVSPKERMEYFNTSSTGTLLNHNISLFYFQNGTYAQMINCERWRHVEKRYFISKQNTWRSSHAMKQMLMMEYVEPQYRRLTGELVFVADHAWQLMFLFDKNDRNTISLQPLLGLSFVEWANPTVLHKDIHVDQHVDLPVPESVEGAIEHMRTMDFDTILDESKTAKMYFWKHMWIPRQNVVMRSLYSWFGIIADAQPGPTGVRSADFKKLSALTPPEYYPGRLSQKLIPKVKLSYQWTQWLENMKAEVKVY